MFLGLVLFWGSSFALTKIAVETISPMWVMALRLVLGAVILFAMMRLQGYSLPLDRKFIALVCWTWRHWFGAAVLFDRLGIASHALWSRWNHDGADAAHDDYPFALHAARRAHEQTKLFGFTIGFIGLIVLVGPHFLDDMDLSGSMFVAQLAIFLAALAYALHTIIARKSPKMSAIQKSTGAIIAAAVIGVVLAMIVDPFGIGIASISSVAATMALGIFPTALAALLLFQLIDRTGTSFMPLSNYLIAPFAYFFGILTLGEPFEMRALVGLTIILVGIYISPNGANLPLRYCGPIHSFPTDEIN